MERRDQETFCDYIDGRPAIEERADGKRMLHGYGAVFFDPTNSGTEYRMPDGAKERVSPKAFNRAIEARQDVVGVIDHSTSVRDTLGRVSAGTLRLFVDQRGLRYEVDLPDTAAARDLAALVQRGDVQGSSFKFIARKQSRSMENGMSIRTLEDVDVFDIGPVLNAAYPATSVGLRSADNEAAMKELEEANAKRLEEAEQSRKQRASYLDRKAALEAK